MPPTSTSVKDKDLFAKLDELEKQELMNNEFDDKNERKVAIGGASTKKTSTKKRVKWKEGFVQERDKEVVAFPKDDKATIKFAHSRKEVLATE